MSKRNRLLTWFVCLIGIFVFAYSLRSVNLSELGSSLAQTNWWWLLVALACMIGYLFFESQVLVLMLGHQRISNRDALRVTFMEQLGNGITPFASGGQPLQLLGLTESGVSGVRAGSVLLMKFVVYQSMIVVNFCAALLTSYSYVMTHMKLMSTLVAFGFFIHLFVIISLLLIMYREQLTRRIVRAILKPLGWFVSAEKIKRWRVYLDGMITEFHKESIALSRQWGMIFKAALLTLAQLGFYYVIPYFILLALGANHVNLLFVISLHIIITLVISIFPIPGGAGGAEVGFSMLFAGFVANKADLVLAMLVWRLITYYFGIFGGIVAYNIKTTTKRKG